MIESMPLAWALTLLFAGTAGYGLLRVARTYAFSTGATVLTGARAPAGAGNVAISSYDRSIGLSHLLMSVAMLAMVWMWGGAGAQVVQLVVFGGFTLLFLLWAGSASREGGRRAGVAFGYHALMAGSMVWMVAAMTIMTGHQWGVASAGHHDAAALGTPELAATPGASAAPFWTVAVTLALVVGLLAAAASWARAARGRSRDRAGAVSHVLLSAGMAVMLLVMI